MRLPAYLWHSRLPQAHSPYHPARVDCYAVVASVRGRPPAPSNFMRRGRSSTRVYAQRLPQRSRNSAPAYPYNCAVGQRFRPAVSQSRAHGAAGCPPPTASQQLHRDADARTRPRRVPISAGGGIHGFRPEPTASITRGVRFVLCVPPDGANRLRAGHTRVRARRGWGLYPDMGRMRRVRAPVWSRTPRGTPYAARQGRGQTGLGGRAGRPVRLGRNGIQTGNRKVVDPPDPAGKITESGLPKR